MLNKEIQEGMRVDIRPLDENTFYQAKIESVNESDGTISINPALKGSVELNLRTTRRFYVTIYTGVSVLKYNGMFIEYDTSERFRVAKISIADETRVQQRFYYRLEKIETINFETYVEPEDEDFADFAMYEKQVDVVKGTGIQVDISAGGLRFKCEVEHEVDEELNFFVKIDEPGKEWMTIKGKIIDCRREANEDIYKYVHRVLFVDMVKEDEDTLSKYIWREQQKRQKVD